MGRRAITEKSTKEDIKGTFKIKDCKVISYNKETQNLDVKFNGYGIRIKNVKNFAGTIATIKYKGEIGKPNFECKV